METVAGLPRYMVLRAKYNGKYMHYLWNADEAKEYYQDMACKHGVDPVSPFAKLEVVPSTTNPSTFIHLRCCYNNRFVKLDTQHGLPWLSATAEALEEGLPKDASSSTLFQPLFKDDDEEPNTIELMHVQTKLLVRVYIKNGPNYPYRIQEVLFLHPYGDRFEFAPWESYDEKMKSKDDEIQKLRDQVAEKTGEMEATRVKIETLKAATEEFLD